MIDSLNYLRDDDSGPVYLHHFGTGHQELQFTSHKSAYDFAQRNGCLLRGPTKVAA